MTVGELKAQLSAFPDHYRVTFADGNVEFYQVKQRDADLIYIEFIQEICRKVDDTWDVLDCPPPAE